jgi:hypothetical protein
MAKNDVHYVVAVGADRQIVDHLAYASRKGAVRGAKRLVHPTHTAYVIEDCGDHWGLWAGFEFGQPGNRGHLLTLPAAALNLDAPLLEEALDKYGPLA